MEESTNAPIQALCRKQTHGKEIANQKEDVLIIMGPSALPERKKTNANWNPEAATSGLRVHMQR